jgi:hypothetical protein
MIADHLAEVQAVRGLRSDARKRISGVSSSWMLADGQRVNSRVLRPKAPSLVPLDSFLPAR